jgi:biopolymer transport protein ExbD
MRFRQSLLLKPPLIFFLLVVFIIISPSSAKGRTSLSSPSSASAYNLDLLQPHPNQRVYGVTDSAGDVFLHLKFVILLSFLRLQSFMLLLLINV